MERSYFSILFHLRLPRGLSHDGPRAGGAPPAHALPLGPVSPVPLTVTSTSPCSREARGSPGTLPGARAGRRPRKRSRARGPSRPAPRPSSRAASASRPRWPTRSRPRRRPSSSSRRAPGVVEVEEVEEGGQMEEADEGGRGGAGAGPVVKRSRRRRRRRRRRRWHLRSQHQVQVLHAARDRRRLLPAQRTAAAE